MLPLLKRHFAEHFGAQPFPLLVFIARPSAHNLAASHFLGRAQWDRLACLRSFHGLPAKAPGLWELLLALKGRWLSWRLPVKYAIEVAGRRVHRKNSVVEHGFVAEGELGQLGHGLAAGVGFECPLVAPVAGLGVERLADAVLEEAVLHFHALLLDLLDLVREADRSLVSLLVDRCPGELASALEGRHSLFRLELERLHLRHRLLLLMLSGPILQNGVFIELNQVQQGLLDHLGFVLLDNFLVVGRQFPLLILESKFFAELRFGKACHGGVAARCGRLLRFAFGLGCFVTVSESEAGLRPLFNHVLGRQLAAARDRYVGFSIVKRFVEKIALPAVEAALSGFGKRVLVAVAAIFLTLALSFLKNAFIQIGKIGLAGRSIKTAILPAFERRAGTEHVLQQIRFPAQLHLVSPSLVT